MNAKKILIVEDDVIIAESHKEKLMSFGFNSFSMAVSKEEAIHKLNTESFAFALLDVRLESEFEGVEIGNYITEKINIPFIYLTAHSDFESIKRMVVSKPLAYLSKPIRNPELFAAISLIEHISTPESNNELTLTEGNSVIKIDKENFLFAQSSGNYINLTFNDESKSRLIRMSLDNLIENANDPTIIRISRFYVVNASNITELHKKHILIGDEKINISTDKYKEIKKITDKK